MKNMSNDDIHAAIRLGMQDLAERFAWDPSPTDGSVQAEQAAWRRFKAAKEAGKLGDMASLKSD